MSRTRRNKSPYIGLGRHLAHKRNKDGSVRDGTPTHYSPSCEHHGGCPHCEGNRLFGDKKREPLVVNESEGINMKIKDGVEVSTDDFFYDLMEGGYLKPEELLEDENDVASVREAMAVLDQFRYACEDQIEDFYR